MIVCAKSLVAIGEIELMSTTVLPLRQARGDAVLAEQHLLDVGRVGHHHEDDVGALAPLRGRVAARVALSAIERRRHLAVRVDEELVAGVDQVAGHRRAHDAEADEADLRGAESVMSVSFVVGMRQCARRWRQPRPASVVAAGLYSQPIQPL